MANIPKVSVITTTFQRPKRLEKAIKSVVNQTFGDWELLIVDDGSQDGRTRKVGRKWEEKDERIRYIEREENFGQHTRPKNEGVMKAGADLIAYLDDDNEYRRDHLQVLYKYLGDNDIVYGDRYLVDETGKGQDMKGVSHDYNAQILTQVNYIDTSDVLIRKEVIEEIGGWDESLPKFADWNLWVRLSKAGYRFQHVPIIITEYHVHEDMNQLKHGNRVDPQTGRPMPTFDPAGCKIWPDETSYGERETLSAAVFTLTMDRFDYTKATYRSMKQKAGYDFDWYVVDNGSQKEQVEWLKRTVEKDKLVLNEENAGISRASNQALDRVGDGYDIILKVDNDCLFLTDDWLAQIVDLYERQQKVVVSPRVEGLRDSPGGVPRKEYAYIGEHFLGIAPHLGGICIVAPAEAYDNFRWEEDDFLHGEQDYVFSQYIRSKGMLLAYEENIIVEHIDTTGGQEKRYPEYFDKRKKLKTTRYDASSSGDGDTELGY